MGDSIKIQDGHKSTKFCGSNSPDPYESSGNELTIAFAVALTSERSSLNRHNQTNAYVHDVTLNKTIEVFERQASSCNMHCFHIRVGSVANESIQNDSTEGYILQSSPLSILGTAGAATVLAGTKKCH